MTPFDLGLIFIIAIGLLLSLGAVLFVKDWQGLPVKKEKSTRAFEVGPEASKERVW